MQPLGAPIILLSVLAIAPIASHAQEMQHGVDRAKGNIWRWFLFPI